MSFEWCFTTYILHECSLKFFLDLNIVIWGINWLKIKDCDTLVYAKLSNSYATCDLTWPLMTASGLYWLVYEMYRYQAGKISFIKIRNRSAWNKNILCQILINIFYILVFPFRLNNRFNSRYALRSKAMDQLFFEWRPLGIDCSLTIERLVLFQDTFMVFLLSNFPNGVDTP